MSKSIRSVIVIVFALLTLAPRLCRADADLLLRWPGHEGAGTRVEDTSGNGLHGSSAASWTGDGEVKALLFDGKPASVVRVQLPRSQCLGTSDWTFMAWLRPEVLGFPGKQDQRRIFNYGKYPDASINIDVTGRGELGWYLTYKDAGGKSVSAGGSTLPRITPGTWVHAALVIDRRNGRMTAYLNGREAGQADLPLGWAGDFSLGNELSIGSAWQNFRGAMADVAVWRRALDDAEVSAAFRAQVNAYGIKLGAGLSVDEAMGDLLDEGNQAMAQRKTPRAREAFGKMSATPGIPPPWAAWAELRIAQAYRLDGNDTAAREVYQRIRDRSDYLPHHRQEAAELLQEMERTSRGLPARDVMASRTVLPTVEHYAQEVFVAPDGNDANSGRADEPVATLARAQSLVRAWRRAGAGPSTAPRTGPVAVILKDGKYRVDDTLSLTSEDSGSPDAPVVWKAAQSGKAVLYGGMRLKGFIPVTEAAALTRLPPEARGHVMVCDLKGLGLTDYGKLAVRGYGHTAPPPTVELYEQGEPLTLARWPNEGFAEAGKLIEPGDKSKGTASIFEYLDDRPARWTTADDAWMFGYFRYLWADSTIKIGKIDPAARRIITAEPYNYGNNLGMDARQGIKYYVFNLLEELDRPGEWYLDRTNGRLYLWPTGDPQRQTLEIGVLPYPFVTLTNASYVRLDGIVCDLGRSDGIRITGGKNVQLVGCTVARVAGTGIAVSGGERHMLLGCDIHHTGRAATTLRGGNRTTLQRADFLVENCHLHDFGRIDRTYTPAIGAEGAGMRFAHNLMHDGPSSAVRLDGNDMLLEYNQTHSVVRESDDQGAMESFGNPTFRGLVFRYNRFENIGNGATMVAGQAAIRFDDVISGVLVYGNVFIRSANGHFGAIQINSGRDNLIDNNLFIDCKAGISGGWHKGNKLWAEAEQGTRKDFIRSDLYLQRYPELAQMLDNHGRNFAWRMAAIDCGPPIRSKASFDILALGEWTTKDPAVAALARNQWDLAADSDIALRLGLRPIPVSEIGLYADRNRATWPVDAKPAAVPDWRQRAGHE